MNLAQRIVVAIYCLLLAYCCVWIFWHVTFGVGQRKFTDVVYSLVWAAPSVGYDPGYAAAPEIGLVFLKVVALTAVSGAGWVLVGLIRRSETAS